jgi:AraC-like DNA-binding protein
MEAVARVLCTSERSLRERLVHTDMEMAELSFLLGFSDVSAFHRAFKRWEGMTPLQYRRAARGASSRARP